MQVRRILITPNVSAPYDHRMVAGLASAFRSMGVDAHASADPLHPSTILDLTEKHNIDTVIQINRTRSPEFELPPNVRHISWFQDVFPETQASFPELFRESDILYTLGDPKVLGVDVDIPCPVIPLFTGVDRNTLKFNCIAQQQRLDISLCGGLPRRICSSRNSLAESMYWIDRLLAPILPQKISHILNDWRRSLYSGDYVIPHFSFEEINEMKNIIASHYRPLRGEIDIHQLAQAIINESSGVKRLKQSRSPNRESSYNASIKKAIDYFSHAYPRVLDRELLASLASQATQSLAFYGNGLNKYDFPKPYYRGVLETQDELLKIYCESKINLHNNTHGLGLHSRTLECMAVGGFIFTHQSPHDTQPGGIATCFEPNVHYGAYEPNTFIDQATYWLANDKKRIQIGRNAKAIIQESHCWEHRAIQVLEDLAR